MTNAEHEHEWKCMRVKIFRHLIKVVACVILLSAVPCFAQNNVSARIDRYIKTEMTRQKIPGISLAVLRNGKIEILKSYGLSNVELNVPVKPETIFQSGSIGKQFTAASVMLLVEEGKISLDEKITKYFAPAPEAWQNITVRHLLTHTSGMGDYPADFDMRRDFTEDDLLAIIKKTPLNFAPGAAWDYSNLGYATLGLLIHKVSGKFHGDFLRERIFKPLEMTTARVISEADIVPNRAAGYRLEAGELKNQEWVSPSVNSTADGALYFSILDLAKWDAALYPDKLFKQSSLNEMWSPVKLSGGATKDYGFGWHTIKIGSRRVMHHGGAWQGFKSYITRFPDDNLTIIFLANSWETRDMKLARGLAAIFYPEFTLPKNEPIEDKEPKTTSLVRRVLLQLSRGKADTELFTSEAKAMIFPERAKKMGELLESLSLPIAVIYTNELVERREENGKRVYSYLLNDMTRSLFCTIKLTKDDKVSDLQLKQIN